MQVPRVYGPQECAEAQSEAWVVVKPRDLGGSFGLKLVEGKTLGPSDFDGRKIVQAFVPGYDVTMAVFVDASTSILNVGDATVYVPAQSDPTDWIYDRHAKEAYVGGSGVSTVRRKQYPLDRRAADKIRTYCASVGVDCYARVDFRLHINHLDQVARIDLDDLSFIEINPMPTVCVGLAFVESVRSWVNRDAEAQNTLSCAGLSADEDYDIIAYVLGHSILRQLGPAKMDDRDQVGS
ncbi:MAG: ATP-grasp domain-containing protein [Pseudomonadota bacterium]